MNIIDLQASEDFRKWWFSLHPDTRKILKIRDCVIGWNAAKQDELLLDMSDD